MNDTAMSDAEARGKLVQKEYLDKNIFLAAGAGSGKTSSLVKRVMALILDGRELSSVVAITFTKEAAKMFYARITKALEDAIKEAPESESKKLLIKALSEIDTAFFGTIDSFCRKLLLEHPSEADISVDITPLEKKSQRHELVAEVFERLVKTREPSAVYSKYRELRDHDLRDGQIINLIETIVQEDIFAIDKGKDPGVFATLEAERQFLQDSLETAEFLRNEYERKFVAGNSRKTAEELTTKGCFSAYLKATRIPDRRHPVKALQYLETMLKAWNYSRSKVPKPEAELERANAILEAEETGRLIRQFENNRYYKALEFGEMMRPIILGVAKERGFITYNQSLNALVGMLEHDEKSGGEMLSYIKAKYRHYLIDEFQDTNPLQTRLFQYLTKDMPGALFIVGDDKQAIYRFRGGDVDNFRNVENQFSSDKQCATLRLSCNFRSSEALRAWFDRKFTEEQFFGQGFPLIEPAEKQKLFDSIAAGVIDGVYEYPVIARKSGRGANEAIPGNEQERVVSMILFLLGRKVSSYDPGRNALTAMEIGYEDIMVITGTKAKLDGYIKAFREAGIPYHVAGSSNLVNSRALRMVDRVLDVMIHPEDRYIEATCLMSEPFSFTEKELYDSLCGRPGDTLQQAKELIQRLRTETERLSPAAIYLSIMEGLMLTRMLSAFQMAEEPDTIYYGLELVRQATAEGVVTDSDSLLAFIREELLSGDYEYEMALAGTPKGVRLMNLHKTKGLEAKVVILADADNPVDRSGRISKCYDYENMKVCFFNIPDSRRGGFTMGNMIETDQFDVLKELEKTKLDEEQTRLKYVAATRAENVLIIPRLYKNETKSGEAALGLIAGDQIDGRWDMLLTQQLEIMDPAGCVIEEKTADIYREPSGPLIPVIHDEPSYVTINPSRAVAKGKIPLTADIEYVSSELDEETEEAILKWRKDGTEIGTLVHRLMETLVNRVHETISEEERSIIIDHILLLNKVAPDNREKFKLWLMRIADKIYDGGFSQDHIKGFDGVPNDIIHELRQSEEICTELPFSVYLDKGDNIMADLAEKLEIETGTDGYVNGVMDLVYKKDGVWHICDYKTNFFTEDLREHYEGQLILYQEILKMLLGLDNKPKAYLYHIPVRNEEAYEEVYLRQ